MFDNRLEEGLANLRLASPRTSSLALVDLARDRANSSRFIRAWAGLSTAAAAAAIGFIALRPVPAKAALASALRHSKSLRPIHLISRGEATDRRDMWFLSDRILTKTAHSVREEQFQGKGLAYNDVCRDGHRFLVDRHTQDLIADPDLGTIDLALELDEHQRGSHVERIGKQLYQGREYMDYRLTDSNPIDGKCTLDYYVDPATNLIRHIEESRTAPDRTVHKDTSDVEYPSPQEAAGEEPKFPRGLTFRTDLQVETAFRQAMKTPEQVKTLNGVRVEFFGLMLTTVSNPTPVLRAFAVTRGGASADAMQDRYVEVTGGPVATKTALEMGPDPGKGHLGYGQPVFWSQEAIIQPEVPLENRRYLVSAANQMLSREPPQVTVRVPVWLPSGQTLTSREGKTSKGHRFIGYVSFKTSRIFCDDGSSTLDLFHLGTRGIGSAGRG